jgi:hypothetical protein
MNTKHTQPPTVECLEDRAVPSTVVFDAGANNRMGSARTFAFSSDGAAKILGVSESNRDRDFFRFTAPADGVVSFGIVGRFARMRIQNAFGADMVDAAPGNGLRGGTIGVMAGQTYFVNLQSARDRPAAYNADLMFTSGFGVSVGQWTDVPLSQFAGLSGLTNIPLPPPLPPVTINPPGGSDSPTPTPTPPGGDTPPPTPAPEPGNQFPEAESNNSLSTANAFDFGSDKFIELQGVVGAEDTDYFTFRPAQTGTIEVSGAAGVRVELLDRNGLVLYDFGDGSDSTTTSNVGAHIDQTFFLRVTSSGEAETAYSANVTLVGLQR